MKVEDLFIQMEKFYQSIKSIHPELLYERIKTNNKPFKDWFREEVPAPGCSKKSGIYIFADNLGEILYIGKAASNNFGSEIYGKFSAATEVDINNLPRFDNSLMAKWAPEKFIETFKIGDIYISGINVIPREFSSLFEVYLHVYCARNGGLPELNKRIG